MQPQHEIEPRSQICNSAMSASQNISMNAIYEQIGRQIVATQQLSGLTNTVNFGKPIGGKKKACNKGYSCGYGCISTKKACQNGLSGQSKTFAEYLDKVGVDNLTDAQKKDAENQGLIKPDAPNVKNIKIAGNTEKSDHNIFDNYPDQVYYEYWEEELEAIDSVSSTLGVNMQDAMQIMQSLFEYSGSDYGPIRDVDAGRSDDPYYIPRSKYVNMYLERAPKYDGPIERGLTWDSEQDRDDYVNSIINGFQSSSMDSWSSSGRVAQSYASRKKYGVVLRTQNKSGSSIKQMSEWDTEDEVLVAKNTNYRVTNVTQQGNLTIIDVDDMGV